MSISLSSSKLGFTRATISLGEWATECLSNSSSKSGSWIIGSTRSFLSSKWNWSISTLSDKCEEAVSSLGTAASGRMRWRGSSTRRRSSRARKLGSDTSIWASRRSPALIALPTSWNASEMGTKSKIRLKARNYLSSLTKILDLNTLLKPGTLTRLSLGATCLLSAKTSEEKNPGQYNVITNGIQKEWRNIKPRGYYHASREQKE